MARPTARAPARARWAATNRVVGRGKRTCQRPSFFRQAEQHSLRPAAAKTDAQPPQTTASPALVRSERVRTLRDGCTCNLPFGLPRAYPRRPDPRCACFVGLLSIIMITRRASTWPRTWPGQSPCRAAPWRAVQYARLCLHVCTCRQPSCTGDPLLLASSEVRSSAAVGCLLEPALSDNHGARTQNSACLIAMLFVPGTACLALAWQPLPPPAVRCTVP